MHEMPRLFDLSISAPAPTVGSGSHAAAMPLRPPVKLAATLMACAWAAAAVVAGAVLIISG